MSCAKINHELSDIPQTMLIPLRARYLETKNPDGIINDPKTIEILDLIDHEWSAEDEVSDGSRKGIAIRTEILDEQTDIFLRKNKNAVIVNLGCGLDTRYSRLNNGSVLWFDLDVPEAIELRRHFFQENENFSFISKSVLDYSWMDIIPKDRPILFIAEGLLMYFKEDEIKSLFKNIKKEFPGSEMVFEAMSPFIAKRTEMHPDMKNQSAKFEWGMKTGKEIEDWGLGIDFINEDYYFDRHKEVIPIGLRLFCLIPAFRKMMKIVHIRF